jgi:hypothetical protein
LLEQAHAAALANNTYVCVGFVQLPNNGGLGLAFVYSPTGNPANFLSDTTVLPRPLCKAVVLKNLNLSTISSTEISDPDRATESVGQLSDSSNVLKIADPANGGNVSSPAQFSASIEGSPQTIVAGGNAPFSTVMEITPSGQVLISSDNKYACIELGLEPVRGNKGDAAVLQMNAFTGRVTKFQP